MTKRSLAGRAVVVIGAGRGIGAATARALARERAGLVLADLREDGLRTTLAAINQMGGRATAVVADVAAPDTLEALRERAIQWLDRVDAVVNCAGVVVPGAVDAVTPADLQRQIDTNFLGTVLVTRAFLPYFRRRGAGHLVHVGSLGGIVPIWRSPWSSATRRSRCRWCVPIPPTRPSSARRPRARVRPCLS